MGIMALKVDIKLNAHYIAATLILGRRPKSLPKEAGQIRSDGFQIRMSEFRSPLIRFFFSFWRFTYMQEVIIPFSEI